MARRWPQRQAGLAEGWRSGLEEGVAASLSARGVAYVYEEETLAYLQPETPRKYTPDFIVYTASKKKLYIETKGRWTTEDRKKMKLVVEQHPDKEFRMVFQYANQKIRKGSKTTYADWAEKLGMKWASKDIPDEWLME